MRIALLLFCALALRISAATPTIFIAPNGSDRASGQSEPAPIATLQHAVELSRRLRSAPGQPVQIVLRGGAYELDSPIDLGPEDSGLAIAAYWNETPVISGGARISHWRPSAQNPNIWRAEIPAARDGLWNFHELFVNGQRRQRARWPKSGFLHIAGLSPKDHPAELPFPPGGVDPAWAARGDVELVLYEAWAQSRNQIRSVNHTGVLSLAGSALPNTFEPHARCFLENVPASLAPGEWRLDRDAGAVSYWPAAGEDLRNARVTAPRLTELVRLNGSIEHPIRGVAFRGITFADTDWPFVGGADMDVQAAIEVHGALRAEWAADCAIDHCVFTRLGGYAVDFADGCERNRIAANQMFDLGAGGVRLGGTDLPRAFAEPSRQNIITDNHIHDIGLVNAPAAGILVLLSGQNLIAHNEIDHTFYTAISVGWVWGYTCSPCRENIVEFNHLHDLGQGLLSDMGGVYTLGPQPGTIVRDNLIHDVNVSLYGGWGLYTDEGSTGIIMESNIVYHCYDAGFHQHYGRENIIRNNIFAFNQKAQLARTRVESHLSLSLSNNIVYYDSGGLLAGNWGGDLEMDGNLYFDTRLHGAPLQGLASWRARGHDLHSIVADPQFAAPDQFDFRLRPSSPALRVGFHPFTLKSAGPR